MSTTTLQKGKGRATASEAYEEDSSTSVQTKTHFKANLDEDSGSGSSSAESDSNSSENDSDSSASDSESSESDSEEVTQEFLDSLLAKARQNAAAKARSSNGSPTGAQEDEIRLDSHNDLDEKQLPPLNPGNLPSPYIQLSESRKAGPSAVRDLDVEQVQRIAASRNIPAAPTPPVEHTAAGKSLTKKERKALKNKTAGPGWFDLPAPTESELPRLYKEVEALRLRNQLDPKRFYRKDEGEGKGIKGLPKHFAIGTIVATSSPFGGPSAENLSRANRKRTLVDELVDDAEAKSYAKKKFKELQTVRGAKGRGTLAQKKALRRPKW